MAESENIAQPIIEIKSLIIIGLLCGEYRSRTGDLFPERFRDM